jgi:uncharacterized protein (DUF305 family)
MATRTWNDRTGEHSQTAHQSGSRAMHAEHYLNFALMIVLSFAAMYAFMYAMVNTYSNVFNNINQIYMAGLMTTPMMLIEILVMRKMYPSKGLNAAIAIGALVLMALCWSGIRNQAGVGDTQFIRSMVPHHSGAILMCNEASIQDPELQKLCGRIVKGQQEEIDEMKAILARLHH